jgi:beta-glucosidase
MMSDWGATHSTVAAANAGLTQEMPSNDFFGPALASAVSAGQVSEEQIDTMTMRILTPLFALNLVDDPPTGTLAANAASAAHNILARELAEASITLLKNDGGILPLNPKEFK